MHWAHEDDSLAEKVERAQSAVRSLLEKQLMRCVAIHYKELKKGTLEVVEAIEVPPERVFQHWSSPYFWSRETGIGAHLLGFSDATKTKIAIEPTSTGETVLDELFAAMEKDSLAAVPGRLRKPT